MCEAGREVSLCRGLLPEVTSLAEYLLGKLTSASHAVMRAELKLWVQQGLNSIDLHDREVSAKTSGDSTDQHVPQHVLAAPTDPDLARVVESWPDLPSHIRAAVLALVGTAPAANEA
jgi:hypothetical protein